jgi:hypothetical protein
LRTKNELKKHPTSHSIENENKVVKKQKTSITKIDDMKEKTLEQNKNNDKLKCAHCEKSPCEWYTFGKIIVQETSILINKLENNKLRKKAYGIYTKHRYGTLGKGNRIEIPKCVIDHIREEWPDKNNQYMGFKPS